MIFFWWQIFLHLMHSRVVWSYLKFLLNQHDWKFLPIILCIPIYIHTYISYKFIHSSNSKAFFVGDHGSVENDSTSLMFWENVHLGKNKTFSTGPRAMERKAWLFSVYMGIIMLPTYMGIYFINHGIRIPIKHNQYNRLGSSIFTLLIYHKKQPFMDR